MTQPPNPPFSGIPQPVQGVTGGPPTLGGQLGNDPQTGNVVISPNPGNATQIRKGSSPQALQVYEYFNSNTDYSRLSLNSQAGGPFQLAVETAPPTVVRELDIIGTPVRIPNLALSQTQTLLAADTPLPTSTQTTLISTPSLQPGFYLVTGMVVYGSPTAGTLCSCAISGGVAANTIGANSNMSNTANANVTVSLIGIIQLAVAGTITLIADSVGAAGTAFKLTPFTSWNGTQLNWIKIG